MAAYDYATDAYVIDGLEWFGEVSLSEPCYDFDLIGVWRDPADGSWWWADDRGCSCPTPFEGITRQDLTHGSAHDLAAAIQNALDDPNAYRTVSDGIRAASVEFIGRVMDQREHHPSG